MVMETIQKYAKTLNKISENKYFTTLVHNPSLPQFVNSQIDFVHAVSEWSNILLKTALQCSNVCDKAIIIDNLYDEHGCGDVTKNHINTFNTMIKTITNNNVVTPTKRSHITNFINDMHKHVDNNNIAFICGMLGMIEYTYITVSDEIYKYLSVHSPNATSHYHLHSEIDYEHARGLFTISCNASDVEQSLAGIDCGYKLMKEVYSGMSTFLNVATSE